MHVGELSGRMRVSEAHYVHAIKSPTYRVYIQNVDVSGSHQKVLEEGSDHVPRFKLSVS